MGLVFAAPTSHQAVAQNVQLARQTQSGSEANPAAAPERSCAVAYHASLAAVKTSAGTKLVNWANAVRNGNPDLPGYWLFWDPQRSAVRRKLARLGNPANAIVIEDRMCARSVLGRGGRIRCLKWVPKPENYRPSPAAQVAPEWSEPAAQSAQLGLLRRLTATVRTRGAVQELRRSGRLYQLTRRVGGELMGYLDQSPRPTICTGAQAMLDFYKRQLQPLEKQFSGAEELIAATQNLMRETAALARVAWSNPDPGDNSSEPSGTAADETSRSTEAPSQPLPPEWRNASAKELVRLTAAIMLPRRHVGYIAAEDTLFTRLLRAREAMSSASAREAPPHVRSAVFLAFRSLEMVHYARLQQAQVEGYRNALFGVIDAIRKRHSAICTCQSQ